MEKQVSCATRADVAMRAGVSVTVVSYVVNNNRYVDKDKRERVLKAMEELHYQPNSIARALKGKSSNHLIFIADRITNGNFGELMSRMDAWAYEKGYFISLCTNRNTEEFVRQIISRRFDGIIISSISFPETFIQQFIDAGVPVVILRNRDYDHVKGAGFIHTGLYKGARQCVRYLYEKGRQNILYLDRISARGHFSTMEDYRLRGFVRQMEEYGLPTEERVITGCVTADEVAAKVVAHIKDHPVDGIFGRNDSMACIGLQAVLSAGLRAPEDVAVMGFDGTEMSRFLRPSLTTMDVEKDRVAKAAIEMIHQIHTEGIVPNPVSFDTRLIEREST